MSGFQEFIQKYMHNFPNVEKKMEQIPPSNPSLKSLNTRHLPSPLTRTLSQLQVVDYCAIVEMCNDCHVFTGSQGISLSISKEVYYAL